MSFTKASPIFHHWRIGSQRMGLTFGCTADGRSFDRGIRVALENLEKGIRRFCQVVLSAFVRLLCGISTS